jgi:hypothetical protein
VPGFILLDQLLELAMDSYFERLHKAITLATSGMSGEALRRHPAGKWSTVEVLEHLYLSYSGTVKGFGRCLQEGKPLASPPTLSQRARIALVTGLGYFPEGRKSPSQVSPRGTSAEQVMADIGPKIEAMDRAIEQCEARYGKGTRLLDHPILGPLTGKQWRKFHWVHGRHHVKQIWKLRKMAEES